MRVSQTWFIKLYSQSHATQHIFVLRHDWYSQKSALQLSYTSIKQQQNKSILEKLKTWHFDVMSLYLSLIIWLWVIIPMPVNTKLKSNLIPLSRSSDIFRSNELGRVTNKTLYLGRLFTRTDRFVVPYKLFLLIYFASQKYWFSGVPLTIFWWLSICGNCRRLVSKIIN